MSFGRSRGAALADFNLDGMLDLVEVNRGENVRVWRNVGLRGRRPTRAPMGNWVALRLQQPGSNRDAVGAWLEVRTDAGTVSRQLTIGGGHASGQLGVDPRGSGRRPTRSTCACDGPTARPDRG